MLRFFRLNDPYRLLVLLIILILFALPIFIFQAPITIPVLKSMLVGEALRDGKFLYVELFDSTAPLSAIFFGLMDWLCGRSVFFRQLISLLLIFIQASFFALILIRNKAYPDSTYLPALIVVILSFISFDFLSLSSELLGSTFLLLAINNLFKEIEFKIQRDEIILNLGFYLGLASLFLLSFALFLVGATIILLVYTRIDLRKYLLLLIGFIMPHVFVMCYYFYNDQLGMLVQNFYYPNLTLSNEDLVSTNTLFVLLAIPIVFLLAAFVKLSNEGRFTKYQSQLSQVMFLWMVFALIHVSIAQELTPHSFFVFIPSAAYFISHFFLLVRRKRLAEYLLVLFLLGIITIATLGRFNRLARISYQSLFVARAEPSFRNKRLMILADGLGNYQNNRQAGYFLDWGLSKKVVDEPDYFEHVMLIKNMFDADAPEMIIDPEDKMKTFFKRLPNIGNKYKKEGTIYTKINN